MEIEIEDVSDAFWQDLMRVEMRGAETSSKENMPPPICAPPHPKLASAECPNATTGGVKGGGGGGDGAQPLSPDNVIPHKKQRRLPPSLLPPRTTTTTVGTNQAPPMKKKASSVAQVILPILTFPGEVVVAETPEEIDAAAGSSSIHSHPPRA